MKQASVFFMILSFLINSEAIGVEWNKLTLTVDNIDYRRGGEISVYLFLKEGFPIKHKKSIKHVRFDAKSQTYELEIAVPDQPFALKVHHDEDRSGGVTKNWTGIIPAEGIGFSAGARLRFSPPSFKQAAMRLPDDGKITITIHYP